MITHVICSNLYSLQKHINAQAIFGTWWCDASSFLYHKYAKFADRLDRERDPANANLLIVDRLGHVASRVYDTRAHCFIRTRRVQAHYRDCDGNANSLNAPLPRSHAASPISMHAIQDSLGLYTLTRESRWLFLQHRWIRPVH